MGRRGNYFVSGREAVGFSAALHRCNSPVGGGDDGWGGEGFGTGQVDRAAVDRGTATRSTKAIIYCIYGYFYGQRMAAAILDLNLSVNLPLYIFVTAFRLPIIPRLTALPALLFTCPAGVAHCEAAEGSSRASERQWGPGRLACAAAPCLEHPVWGPQPSGGGRQCVGRSGGASTFVRVCCRVSNRSISDRRSTRSGGRGGGRSCGRGGGRLRGRGGVAGCRSWGDGRPGWLGAGGNCGGRRCRGISTCAAPQSLCRGLD